MNPGAARRFRLALAASLLLHAVVATAPGWHVPDLGSGSPVRLDAQLVPIVPMVPDVPPPAAAAAVAPAPRPAPRIAPVQPTPEVPVARTPDPPSAPATPPPAPPAAAAQPEGVSSASTFGKVFPRSGRLTFKVLRGDGLWVGQSEHVWQHDGERYEIRAVTETVGIAAMFRDAKVVQESRGLILPSGLQPLEFRTLRDGKLREAARIDPEQGLVHLGRKEPVPASGLVQDLLSSFFQHGALSGTKQDYRMTITTGRRVTEYQVVFDGMEKIYSPWGEREVRHLRIQAASKSDSSEVWLDELTRLPFMIRYRDTKGEVYDQVLANVEMEEPKK